MQNTLSHVQLLASGWLSSQNLSYSSNKKPHYCRGIVQCTVLVEILTAAVVTDHSRLLEIAPFDRKLSSYKPSILTMFLSLHPFWDMVRYWLKITHFIIPSLYLAPPIGATALDFLPVSLTSQNYRVPGLLWGIDSMILHLAIYSIHWRACDGQTDRHRAIASPTLDGVVHNVKWHIFQVTDRFTNIIGLQSHNSRRCGYQLPRKLVTTRRRPVQIFFMHKQQIAYRMFDIDLLQITDMYAQLCASGISVYSY